MANFEQAYSLTMGHEGGYANNPNDRGGETYKGIARKFFPGWSGWDIIDTYKDKSQLSKDETLQKRVRAFYKEHFWNALSLDFVNNQSIATELFDTGVNMGIGQAAMFLQTILNVSNRGGKDYQDVIKDGKIGPKTVAILNAHPRPDEVLKGLNCLQGAKYIAICEHNPSQEVFYVGWMKRVHLA
jgi:lysozyme family protein